MLQNIEQRKVALMKTDFFRGVRHGIPIALGYISVSFGFGIMAVGTGLSPLTAVMISVTNLTSAGQAAGVSVIAAGGTLAEMALTQLIINIRYSLMGFSLSQKLSRNFGTARRMAASFGITDEIFAVASSQPHEITPSYMYGLIAAGFFGWSLGTLLGALAGQILPQPFTDAMGLVLYGMFLAIIIPPARRKLSVLSVVLIAAGISVLCKYAFTFLSGGFSVIISGVAAAAAGALLFPVKDGEV